MGLEPVGACLDTLLRSLGLEKSLKGWQAIELWPRVVGDPAAARSRAVGFEAGRLIVEVDGAAWTTQLSYLKRDIVKQLNERLGEAVIREIHFSPARGDRP